MSQQARGPTGGLPAEWIESVRQQARILDLVPRRPCARPVARRCRNSPSATASFGLPSIRRPGSLEAERRERERLRAQGAEPQQECHQAWL